MNLLWQGQSLDAPRDNEMEFDAPVMPLFGGTKADVGQIVFDPSVIGTSAAGSEQDEYRRGSR
jgi:hypothetical protein